MLRSVVLSVGNGGKKQAESMESDMKTKTKNRIMYTIAVTRFVDYAVCALPNLLKLFILLHCFVLVSEHSNR